MQTLSLTNKLANILGYNKIFSLFTLTSKIEYQLNNGYFNVLKSFGPQDAYSLGSLNYGHLVICTPACINTFDEQASIRAAVLDPL